MIPPVACTLTEGELRERRQTILDLVRASALHAAPLALGVACYFRPAPEVLAQLARLVDLERQCCPFLTFRIVVAAGPQPFCLEVTGPPEAKAIVGDFFGHAELPLP